MIKVFALLPVRPDLTVDEFHRHWSTVHRDHAVRIERIRRYVQAHRVRPGLPGLTEAEWEGVPEVWFDSLESAVAQRTDPQYTEFARVDEPSFIDMPGLRRVTTESRVVRDPGPARTKLMLFAHWLSAGSPLHQVGRQSTASIGEALLESAPGLSGLAVSQAFATAHLPRLPDGAIPTTQPFDIVLELWWPDLEAVRIGWDQGRDAILGTLAGRLDLTRARGFLCEELRVVDR
ncbi:hypothetical protein GCM10027053_01450 [Intrasporangium mesophilum]